MVKIQSSAFIMLRREPSHVTTVSDRELGIAAVLFLIGIALTTLVIPGFF